MLTPLLAVASLHTLLRGPVPATMAIGDFVVEWGEKGVNVGCGAKSKWHTDEVMAYRPYYLAPSKAFVVVTDASGGKYHVTVVDRALRVRCQLEINGAAAGVPQVVPCADTLCFVDPGLFARAPIQSEQNTSWLEARRQLNVMVFSIGTGSLRWRRPELEVGQPLASSGVYLWTVRLANASDAYAGAKSQYEIEQVGCHTGKVMRSWAYPGSGVDLECYRWQAEIHGTQCTLRRLEPWPDVSLDGNSSPKEITLSRILQNPKPKRRARKRLRPKAKRAGPVASDPWNPHG